MSLRIFKTLVAAILATLALCHGGWAQNYPNGPVRIIVGYGAGGPDTTARLLAAQLSAQTGQTFYVENHPGAGSEVGTAVVVQAPPDGYTLLLASDSMAILPSTVKNMPFDVEKALIPVSMVAQSGGAFLLVNNDLPVHNLQELLAYARASKTPLKYSSSGIASGYNLRMVVFADAEKLSLVHIPFKGAGDAATAVMGGEVQLTFLTGEASVSLIKAGKVRAIAYDNPTRDPALPDVPTLVEAGVPPGKVGNSWHGVFAPAKTPEPIVAWLGTEIKKAVEDPATAEKLKDIGLHPVGGPPEQLKQTLATYVANMHDVLAEAGIQPQ